MGRMKMLAGAAAAPGSNQRRTVVDDDVGLDVRLELLLPSMVEAEMGNDLGDCYYLYVWCLPEAVGLYLHS